MTDSNNQTPNTQDPMFSVNGVGINPAAILYTSFAALTLGSTYLAMKYKHLFKKNTVDESALENVQTLNPASNELEENLDTALNQGVDNQVIEVSSEEELNAGQENSAPVDLTGIPVEKEKSNSDNSDLQAEPTSPDVDTGAAPVTPLFTGRRARARAARPVDPNSIGARIGNGSLTRQAKVRVKPE